MRYRILIVAGMKCEIGYWVDEWASTNDALPLAFSDGIGAISNEDDKIYLENILSDGLSY